MHQRYYVPVNMDKLVYLWPQIYQNIVYYRKYGQKCSLFLSIF